MIEDEDRFRISLKDSYRIFMIQVANCINILNT